MFGPYIDPLHIGLQYFRLSSLPRSPFRIHLPHWRSMPCFSAIAFEGLYGQDTRAPLMAATIRTPPADAIWYYSTCRLSHVIQVTLCREHGKEGYRVMGMLLLYSDGTRACVGQYRLDWAMRPLAVCKDSFAVRSVRRRFGNRVYMYRDVDLQVDPGSISGDTLYSWRLIPWSGTMEWWFTRKTSVIHHQSI